MTDGIDEEGTRRLPAERYGDLDQALRKLFDNMREDDAETLRALLRLGPDGTKQLLETIRLAQSVMNVSRFMRWLILTIVGAAVLGATFAESIMKLVRLIWPKELGQ